MTKERTIGHAASSGAPQAPLQGSYWAIPGRLLAGAYPGSPLKPEMTQKIKSLALAGINHAINLMEPDELDHSGRGFQPYSEGLKNLVESRGQTYRFDRFPIRDLGVPSRETMVRILDAVDRSLAEGHRVYVHCWGGRGRTGTVIGCFLIRRGLADPGDVFSSLGELRASGWETWGPSPETEAQKALVLSWNQGE